METVLCRIFEDLHIFDDFEEVREWAVPLTASKLWICTEDKKSPVEISTRAVAQAISLGFSIDPIYGTGKITLVPKEKLEKCERSMLFGHYLINSVEQKRGFNQNTHHRVK